MRNLEIRANVREFMRLDSNVLILFLAIFLVTFGEQLWMEYLPVYFIELGGTIFMLGVFKSFSDTLEGLNQIPGGMISDRLGRTISSMLFLLFGAGGYFIYFIAPNWKILFIGLIFIQGTSSLLQPTVFAIVGDYLSTEKRSNAFSIQSVLKRLPIIIAPTIGGFIIGSIGVIDGVKRGLMISLVLGLFSIILIFIVSLKYKIHDKNEIKIPLDSPKSLLPKKLRPLLLADIMARFGQGLVKTFLILHVIEIVSYQEFGVLVGIQMTVAIISYIPASFAVNKVGHRPVIIVSFVCFALYPSIIVFAGNLYFLVVGYAVAGFREFGEPARKALIVDFSSIEGRGKNIGFYYSMRTFAVVPTTIIGSIIWKHSPQIVALLASAIALIGLLVFYFFVTTCELSQSGVSS